MRPVLEAPHVEAGVKAVAFSQYPRCPQYDMLKDFSNWECLNVKNEDISVMGYSVRTITHRYTEWRRWARCQANWSSSANLLASELYDHRNDTGLGRSSFEDFENVNLAQLPESGPLVAQLGALLRAQFGRSVAVPC